MQEIQTIRVYDDLSGFQGARFLVDRLWPRGRKKTDLKLDGWAREAAPSTELRKKYHGGDMDFADFQKAYIEELDQARAAGELEEFLQAIRTRLADGPVAFLYGARSEQNHAVVLKAWVEQHL